MLQLLQKHTGAHRSQRETAAATSRVLVLAFPPNSSVCFEVPWAAVP